MTSMFHGCFIAETDHVHTCRIETIPKRFLLRIGVVFTLAVTQIGTIPLRSNTWSETISEWISQNVNSMKRNHDA